MDGITCKVLVDPITSLLLPVVWNDIIGSCLSGGFILSSDKKKNVRGRRWYIKETVSHQEAVPVSDKTEHQKVHHLKAL